MIQFPMRNNKNEFESIVNAAEYWEHIAPYIVYHFLIVLFIDEKQFITLIFRTIITYFYAH